MPPKVSPSAPSPHHRAGSSLYYALSRTPKGQRIALTTWSQWWFEVSSIPMTVSDPGVGQTKLTWWHKEVANTFNESPQHPITSALLNEVGGTQHLPPLALWNSQIQGLQDLLQQSRWLDEASIRKHGLNTTGAACEGAAWLLGVSSPEGLATAREIGWGLRQAHHLARLGQDARAGLLNVAVSTLQQHDVKAHELLRPSGQQAPKNWPALLAYLHQAARTTLQGALDRRAHLAKAERIALRPLVILAAQKMALMDEIAQQGDRVLNQRLLLTPIRKWWISVTTR